MTTSIVPRNQALDTTPYTIFHPPPLVPGTNGVAVPKPGANAVLCIAPSEATTHNMHWGQTLNLHTGEPHLAISPDDTYPNQVFLRDYAIKASVANDHPLARTLAEFWDTRGFGPAQLLAVWSDYLKRFKKPPSWVKMVRRELAQGRVFFFAEKTQPIIVRGVVDLRFMTSEGPTRLEHGAILAEHPDDRTNQWLLRAEKFAKRYEWAKQPKSGLLIPTVVQNEQ